MSNGGSATSHATRRALRVCHILGHLRFGGAERQVVNLVSHMPCARTSIICLCKREEGGLSGFIPEQVQVTWMGFKARYAPYHIWKLARELTRMAPDVVHTHMFWANLYGVLAARLSGVPAIVTCEHGTNPWKTSLHHAIERHIISPLVHRRICVSRDILAIRRDVDGVPVSKLVHIPNGTALWTAGTLEARGTYTFGTVGRLIPAKDYLTLIRATALLRNRGHDVELRIVGEGPDRERLEREVEASGLTSTVHLEGFQSDVKSWLRRFHCFVLSSIREGQPMVMLEAMAAGLPIVATAVGGIPDTLLAGSEGLLVAPGDPTALANAMEMVVVDEALRRKLGTNALARCEKDFSIHAICERYMDIYHDILGDRTDAVIA